MFQVNIKDTTTTPGVFNVYGVFNVSFEHILHLVLELIFLE